MDFISNIINNVLGSLYSTFGASLLITLLGIFTYMYIKEHGVKNSFMNLKSNLKNNIRFIILILFLFYTSMLLLRTVLCRHIWDMPLGNVLGTWGLHNSNNELYTENIENIILFIPFSALFFALIDLKSKISKRIAFLKCLGISLAFGFACSFGIELTQLLFKLGCFQLSDLFFNTIGGVIGGILYFVIYKIIETKRK